MGGDREDYGVSYERDYNTDEIDDYDPDDFEIGGYDPERNGRKKKTDPGHDMGVVEVVRMTDAAVCVRGSGLSSDPFGMKDPNEEAWIPKSQIHGRSQVNWETGIGQSGRLVITKWLAEKKGLI